MPELPEVENLRRDIQQHLTGATISGVELPWPGAVGYPDPLSFAETLGGKTITGTDRRAKYLILELSAGLALVIHLRMSGQLLLRQGADPADAYTRVILTLVDGREIRFCDPRKFGRLYLFRPAELTQRFAALGPEPLDAGFTLACFTALLTGRNRQMKALLLDQTVLVGLGNIYADESLFLAGIHPLRRSRTLSPAEIERLYEGILLVLNASIANLGTSFGRYVNLFGQRGFNKGVLAVYDRAGQPCLRCGAPIQYQRIAGRGTHLCPGCQLRA